MSFLPKHTPVPLTLTDDEYAIYTKYKKLFDRPGGPRARVNCSIVLKMEINDMLSRAKRYEEEDASLPQ
jgi:hypothetical protein